MTEKTGSEIEALHTFVADFEAQSSSFMRFFRILLAAYLIYACCALVVGVFILGRPFPGLVFAVLMPGVALWAWYGSRKDRLHDLTRNGALPVLCGMVGLRYTPNDPSAEFRVKQGRWAGVIKGKEISICDSVAGHLDGKAFTVDAVKLVDDNSEEDVTRFKGLILGIALDPGRPPLVIRRAKSHIGRKVSEALGGNRPLPNRLEREIKPGRDEPLAVFYHVYNGLAEQLERIERASDASKTLSRFRIGIRGLVQDETRLLLFLESEVDWFMLRDIEADGVELTKQLNRILEDLSLCIQLAEIWNKT